MICLVIGNWTERLGPHDDCGHFGARKQFYLGLSRQLQNWVHRSTPLSFGTIIKLKPTLDGNWSWRLTFLPFPPSRVFDIKTSAGHLRTGANTPLPQLRRFWRSERLADPRILQQQKTRH